MRLLYFYAILFISSFAISIEDIDFDHSSGLDLMKNYSAQYVEKNAESRINLLRENYKKLLPSKTSWQKQPIIPKVIHFIWISNNSLPQNFQYYLQTWKEHHPEWEIKFWTEKDVMKENFSSTDLYWLARSYQERSDIIRYEILYRYGGLYVDLDVECFKSFDELHHKYEFYANFEPPAVNKKQVSILNAMIGSVAKHPILKEALDKIRLNWGIVENSFVQENSTKWSSFQRSNHNLAVNRTMFPFVNSVFDFLENKANIDHKIMILPSGYNIPIYFKNNTPITSFFSKLFRDKVKLSNMPQIRPETMSFHYYDKQNSLIEIDDFSSSLFRYSEFKGILYMAFNFKNANFLMFRKLFKFNAPTNVEYQIFPVIPRIIYLDSDISNIEDKIAKWKGLNPLFNIKAIDSKDILQITPSKFHHLPLNLLKLIGKFYLLHKSGGVYVDDNFNPVNLSEFNQKYGYYGKFKDIKNLNQPLALDSNIIGVKDNHSIMRNLIAKLDSLKAEEITKESVENYYLEYVYKYRDLDGISIVFPTILFDQKR
jgi:hypothetical protein